MSKLTDEELRPIDRKYFKITVFFLNQTINEIKIILKIFPDGGERYKSKVKKKNQNFKVKS